MQFAASHNDVLNPPQADLPNLEHLTFDDYKHIYEPSDDTYLFVDTLHADIELLRELSPKLCLEVGAGSGCVTAALSQVLQKANVTCSFVLSDINPKALDACTRTADANDWMRGRSEVIQADLLSALQLRNQVDVLLFNPPYVPSEPEEVGTSDFLLTACSGGIDGRAVLDRMLPELGRLIAPQGCVYLIAVEENRPEVIMSVLSSQGFKCNIISRRRAHNERLMVIRAVKEM